MLTYSRNIFDTTDTFEAMFRSLGLAGPLRNGLPIRIHEEENAYIAQTPVPGVPSDAIEITVAGNHLTLTIRSQSSAAEQEAEDGESAGETRVFASRTIALPTEVDQSAIEADHRLGVLTLRLPKAQSALPRRIEIRGESSE